MASVGIVLVVAEAPMILAARFLGFARGSLVITVLAFVVVYLLVRTAPTVSRESWFGRLLWKTRLWWEKRHSGSNVVYWALRLGGRLGLLALSVTAGPVMTGITISFFRQPLWWELFLSSFFFSVVWVGFYAGLWSLWR
jgi:hypothetical protein